MMRVVKRDFPLVPDAAYWFTRRTLSVLAPNAHTPVFAKVSSKLTTEREVNLCCRGTEVSTAVDEGVPPRVRLRRRERLPADRSPDIQHAAEHYVILSDRTETRGKRDATARSAA